uniref:SMP-30/Gluconolactonase/LRE-like region domain-containing protein n=1 Tax=Leersia perrieri TaxID=77586 RepID=A0A0D9WC87_9ORYZ
MSSGHVRGLAVAASLLDVGRAAATCPIYTLTLHRRLIQLHLITTRTYASTTTNIHLPIILNCLLIAAPQIRIRSLEVSDRKIRSEVEDLQPTTSSRMSDGIIWDDQRNVFAACRYNGIHWI